MPQTTNERTHPDARLTGIRRRHGRLTRRALIAAAIALMSSTFATAAPLGFIAMRVYLPPGGTTADIVPPTLVFENRDGTSTTIHPCADKTAATAELLRMQLDNQTGCAWALGYGVDEMRSLNIAAPDSSAHYWLTPFQPLESLHRIRIKGQFPESRYLSFVTYDSTLNTWLALSENPQLTDYEITPDAGHMNPWQQPALAGGRFTVDIARDRADAGANHLPMPPTTEGNIIEILKAMPSPADNCAPENPCMPYSRFARPPASLEAGMAPNDDSAYIMSWNAFGQGVVQVIRGKLPQVTKGNRAQPWPSSGDALRYLSFCTYPMMKPYPLGACLNDEELKLDQNGYYTLVVGAPLARPSSVTRRGHNWLPHHANPLVDHMVLLRNMVSQDAFTRSALNVPKDGSAASAANIMGEYYPQSKLCTVLSYQLRGANCKAL
jgi:hypothetical protein